MAFTKLQYGRPKTVRDTLSGQFVQSGKHQTADVLVGAGVSKRVMSDAELKHRKKLQAGIAVTTSTLGLTALGMKGGAVAAGRVARSAAKANKALPGGPAKYSPAALKAKKFKKLSSDLDRNAINTGIVSSGIGGLGGYNFASYTRAESKKKQPVVAKSLGGTMDFGLGGVTQGENVISKASWSRPLNISAKKSTAFGINVVGTRKVGVKTPFNNPSVHTTIKASAPGSKVLQTQVTHQKGSLTPLGKTGAAALATGVASGGVYSGVKRVQRKREGAVAKAYRPYDPERNRQRRLDAYSTGAMAGSGAAATGAVIHGSRAAQHAGAYRRTSSTIHAVNPKNLKSVGDAREAFKMSRAANVHGVKALKATGKAGAFGLGAAGLAVGSDRIRQYKKGRGRSYSPLRAIGY